MARCAKRIDPTQARCRRATLALSRASSALSATCQVGLIECAARAVCELFRTPVAVQEGKGAVLPQELQAIIDAFDRETGRARRKQTRKAQSAALATALANGKLAVFPKRL